MPFSRLAPLTLAAFFALYLIWGSTYLAIRIGVESWPPLLMAGIRFLLAGSLMLAFLRWRGQPWPTAAQLRGAMLLGVLMPAIGNGLVTVAEREVSSGVAALVIATVPLFTLLFAGLFGHKARKMEWAGMLLGVAGIVLLNLGSSLRASPQGALLLLLASAGWALGSACSRKVPQPAGAMGSAWTMIFGGLALLLSSVAVGERLQAWPGAAGWSALLYLTVFGSMLGYSAYLYLLKTVSAAAATSYAYVNPVIAVLLGAVFLGEQVGGQEMLAMAVIVAAVVLISWRR
ncbi:drug/metabolite exporter YedA [Chromobacterium sphagni]|uniref:Drug/metabolite exporter YedA n=1 Tax=Chromobacterium sphagni TaxID=1903179 RepID=A0A1S1WZ45_9NEIS|nr:drug/metabolite exporter YedA [Chromobacterium sphagni]OHX12435.1 drug/metabolite exporter YedA [Chromobacterium sphagni]OHX21480.1 drug/metabolite exporter YedA [Chromobacterium sphagni]